MIKLNRTCCACKTKYSYCPSCSRTDALKPLWYREFCSEPCMEIWTTCTKYNMGLLTKDEAKKIISEINLRPIGEYAACIQRDYAKLTETKKASKRGKRIEINPIDDAANIEPEVIQSIIEEMATEPTQHEVVLTEKE